MKRPDLLWVNLTVSLREAELPSSFRDRFDVRSCADRLDLDVELARHVPDVICFDYDYPDRPGLRLLVETKRKYPSLPLIMMTLQHSEALAIWAFRSKVWDYLVKPVPNHEAERCLHSLLSIRHYGRNQDPRTLAFQGNRLPAEISTGVKQKDSSLAPAIYYVEQYYRSKLRSDEVAQLCGMSPFRFSRAFKESFGRTFRDYVVDYRLKEACRLLENPRTTVTDVAYAVGFNDASYFARIFKQRIGTPPSLMVGQKNIAAKRVDADGPELDIPHIIS